MEQVLFEQHARLVNGVNKVFGKTTRRVMELSTLFIALASGISLMILHAIYITNSSNSHVNCLMTYYDAHNISKPSTSIHEYDIIKLTIQRVSNDAAEEQCAASYTSCEGSAVNTSKRNFNDNVYLFSLDRGAMMLADETMQYHNFTMLDINFPSSASCFGPPLTSRIIKDYLGYDLIVLNWAVAAFEGEGFMYKVDRRELFNLNHAGDFVSKKGVSLVDEKNSVRYKDPLALPTLVLEGLAKLGIGEKSVVLYQFAMDKAQLLWQALERSETFRPVTKQLAWVFADEFVSTSNSGSTVNSFFNLMYSAVRIGNSRWTHMSQSAPQLHQYVMFRLGVIFSSTFLFFVTTTLISYTLRETQERMLRFTHQLQHHIRNDLPYWSLVFSHLVESLVFVPIIVGIHFFLVEFFSDQLLAFMVLLMVWMGEVFSVLSLRSKASIRFFPKLFCGYFYLFHIYFFCFPYGFSYLAWLTAMLFILHATMHLMNHYEIPAFEQGIITARNPRVGLIDLEALARAEEAAAAMLYTPQSNGAVFRRMQALRRAAQLAEEAGLDTPQRRGRGRNGRQRSSTSTSQPGSVRPATSSSADNLLTGTALTTGSSQSSSSGTGGRARTSSADAPKSKFLLTPGRDLSARSGSVGRPTQAPSTQAPAPTTKQSTSRLPILAFGRSDSMALYTDVIDEEMRMAEALKSSNALSAQGGKEKKASSKTKKASAGKKGPAEGEPMVVGVQRTGSGDSDFGLLLYSDEEDERAAAARQEPGQHDSDSGADSDSDYESEEEQEEEEKRFFVFGAVTGAAKSGIIDPSLAATEGNGEAGAVKPKKKRSKRPVDVASQPMPASAMAPNIFETMEARRARLAQQAKQGQQQAQSTTAGATPAPATSAPTAAPRARAGLELSNPSQAAPAAPRTTSDTDTTPGSASTASASPAKRAGRNPNRESLSDYGFESAEFSVFGELLKRK